MGFFDKLKKGLNKTRENLTNKIEKLVIGYADIDDDFLDELEETLIIPAALKVFTADDWVAIDAAFARNRDPLAKGAELSPEYERLFHRIVRIAPSPIGLGETEG